MRNIFWVLACLLGSGLSSLLGAQTSSSQTAPKPAQAQTVALSQSESLDFLTPVNNDGKLVPGAVIYNVKLRGLKAEDCFGVRLANGQRLAGWSPSKGFGYSGTMEEQGPDGKFGSPQHFQIIGFLYSEFPFAIGSRRFVAGSYALEIFKDSFRLVGNDPEHTGPVNYRTGEPTPLPKTAKLSLKEPLADTVVGEHATEASSYSVSAKGGDIVLSFRGNEWKIAPQ